MQGAKRKPAWLPAGYQWEPYSYAAEMFLGKDTINAFKWVTRLLTGKWIASATPAVGEAIAIRFFIRP